MLFSVYQEVFGHFPTIPDHFGRFPKFSKEKFENFRLPCGTKFLRVLIFASFAIFQAIRKNKFPQIKNTANILSAKIFATVNILYNLNSLHKQTVYNEILVTIQQYIQYPLLNVVNVLSQLATLQTCHEEGFTLGTHTIVLFENIYFYCTYSKKTKILSMLGTGYFLKTGKINFQQEKSICPYRKN